MSFHTDFDAFLKASSPITVACPGGVFNELYPESQVVFPVLVYRQVSEIEISPDMEYPDDEAIEQVRYQVDIWGELVSDVVPAADVVKHTLINFAGAMGGTTVQRIELASRSDQGERYGDKRRRRKSMDFIIFLS